MLVIDMSFDGNIVRKITQELRETLITGRINKIYQLSKYDLLFNINSPEGKKQLLISNSPAYSRIHLTEMNYEKPDTPPTFCMFLRKHLEGGIIKDIIQITNDRVIVFLVQSRNELGDLTSKKFILEVMGRHSNIIIADENNKILEAIKHVMPFDGKDRTIYPGAIYEFPSSSKINPFDIPAREEFLSNPENLTEKCLLDNFTGFSPLITREIMHIFNTTKKSISIIFNEILDSNNPTIISAKKDYFYFTDITYIEGERKTFESVNKMLDRYYYERDSIDIVKQKSKDLVKFIKNHINKAKNKIEKLNKDLIKTNTRDSIRIKGELIQANLHNILKGDSKLECINYYDNEKIVIDLDPKLSPVKNSEKYFKKYKKLKTSIPYIHKQIKEALLEVRYFEQLLHQVENSSLKDIEEIKEELVEKRYIKKKIKIVKRKKRPNFETYFDIDGITILVGKNNLQNEYITHKLAKHNEVWFHVKDSPGSHVVVKSSFPLSETTIRTAAQLAAHFSKMKKSSSVAVDYLEVRYLKKVPGKINSFVTYKNNKTIYIDPDDDFVINLRKK
jgi:predicted ribosome quality control (RQC) complex YloA/Tae2 family protein